MTDPGKAYNIFHLREMAKKRLPKMVFEFLDRGAEDDIALRNNRAAYERIKMLPRFAVDVSGRKTEATILGKRHAMPLAICPTGGVGLLWPRGDLVLAKAAAAADIPFTLANPSTTSMERIASEAGGRLWFQLYIWADKALSRQLALRAQSVGMDALVVTIDGPVPGNREYNKVNGFGMPFKIRSKHVADFMLHPHWFSNVIIRYWLSGGLPRFENFPDGFNYRMTDPAPKGRSRGDGLIWDDIKQFRDLWKKTFVVKGIMHPDDAKKAVEIGADAILVSNHGGRYFDSTPAPIDMVPDIVAAVAGRASVMVDSGVRRGSDIAKARAFGAEAAMIGRATLYGLAAAGQEGATRALTILKKELSDHMAMLGCADVSEIGAHLLANTPTLGSDAALRHLAHDVRAPDPGRG